MEVNSVRAESKHSAPLCRSSVTTARRRPCTTAAGTPPTAPSSVSRSTGTPTTNEPAVGRDEQTPPPCQPFTAHRWLPPPPPVSQYPPHTHTLTHTHVPPASSPAFLRNFVDVSSLNRETFLQFLFNVWTFFLFTFCFWAQRYGVMFLFSFYCFCNIFSFFVFFSLLKCFFWSSCVRECDI